jgi:hypothetical protein
VVAGLDMDRGTRGPAVDPALRTTRPGVLAAGNLLHGAETADLAALSGRHAGAAAARFLDGAAWPTARVPIECDPPLHWIAPNAIAADAAAHAVPPRGRFALRSLVFARRPRVEVAQDGRTLWAGRIARLVPGRSASLPCDWTSDVDPGGGPVSVRLPRGG